MALARDAGPRRNLSQGEVAVSLQELLGPLDAACEDVLVVRQPGDRLELAGELAGRAGRRVPALPFAMTCVSLESPADGIDCSSVFQPDPPPAGGPHG